MGVQGAVCWWLPVTWVLCNTGRAPLIALRRLGGGGGWGGGGGTGGGVLVVACDVGAA